MNLKVQEGVITVCVYMAEVKRQNPYNKNKDTSSGDC